MLDQLDVDDIAFSDDGAHIGTGGADGLLRIWETKTKREVARVAHKGPVRQVCFSGMGAMWRWVSELPALSRSLRMSHCSVHRIRLQTFAPAWGAILLATSGIDIWVGTLSRYLPEVVNNFTS